MYNRKAFKASIDDLQNPYRNKMRIENRNNCYHSNANCRINTDPAPEANSFNPERSY
jgi:hypothetical protein